MNVRCTIYSDILTAVLCQCWNLLHQQPSFDLRVEKRGPAALGTGHVCRVMTGACVQAPSAPNLHIHRVSLP